MIFLSPTPFAISSSFLSTDRSVLNTCHQDRSQKGNNNRYIIKSHGNLHNILKQNPKSQIQDQKNPDRQQCNHISFFFISSINNSLHHSLYSRYFFPGDLCLSYHISLSLSCCRHKLLYIFDTILLSLIFFTLFNKIFTN